MEIVVSVHRDCRDEKMGDWKAPFKKLKLSKVRAEKEWVILLDVNDKELKKIHSLLDGRFRIETVMEPDMEPDKEKETWDGKTALLAQNVNVKAVKA